LTYLSSTEYDSGNYYSFPVIYILQFIRIIIDVEIHPRPGTYNSNLPMDITIYQ
jgi:hypothetical protein